MIALAEAFREESTRLDKAGDKYGARLYEKAATKVESMLDVAEGEGPEMPSPADMGKQLGVTTEGAPPAATKTQPL